MMEYSSWFSDEIVCIYQHNGQGDEKLILLTKRNPLPVQEAGFLLDGYLFIIG
jgi:hypothetical protein